MRILSTALLFGISLSLLQAKHLLPQPETDSVFIKVFVSFSIDRNGNVTDVKKDSTVCVDCDLKQLKAETISATEAEAVRVVSKLPKMDGERATKFTLPIRVKVPVAGYANTTPAEQEGQGKK